MQKSKMQIEIPNFETPRERLLWLCKGLNIANLSAKELHAAQTFPYLEDTNITDDFILGTQNVLLVIAEAMITFDEYTFDLQLLSKVYLYHWYIKNVETVEDFTDTEWTV